MSSDRAANSPADMEQAVPNTALHAKDYQGFDSPVRIHIHSIRKRLTDADGVSAKAAIDGIVAAGILQDDSPEYVKEVSYSQEKGSEEKTIITISKVND